MRNLLSLHIETKVSLTIIMIMVVIFLVTVFKSIDNFNKFMDRINQYEEIRVQKDSQR